MRHLFESVIDEIDKVLAKHYGFTDEELDFIINYDIKYRMGDELEGDGERVGNWTCSHGRTTAYCCKTDSLKPASTPPRGGGGGGCAASGAG